MNPPFDTGQTTAADWEIEHTSRGFNTSPELNALSAEYYNLNHQYLELKQEHAPGLEAMQEQLRTFSRREWELGSALNPPVHEVGTVLQYQSTLPHAYGDKPRTVRVTGSQFNTTSGRIYHVVDLINPDHHITGARAEQLSSPDAAPAGWRSRLQQLNQQIS